jgi:hypothetical protein
MDKDTFTSHYIVTFLASYAAETYDFNALHGLKAQHPVEDAIFLANKAWEELQKHK